METIRIDGYIGREHYSLAQLDAALATLPEGTTQVTVEINSGGGSVIEGYAIHDRLKASQYEIFTDVIGQCSSIATVIALAAKKSNRSMSANAEYGIHFPYWTPDAPIPFEAKDLINLGEELMQAQKKILELYIQETGQSKRVLEPLMENSKTMTAKEAKQLGFISTINSEFVSLQRYKIAAFMEKTKPTDMEFSASQKSWIETKFNEFTEKFNKVFTPVFKAMMIDLASGDQIFIESEDGEFVGKKAFEADQGKQTTIPAKDGEHKLKDGRTITVAGGVVTAVKEAVAEDVAALKTELETVKAELEAEKIKAQTAQTEKTALETNVVALKNEVTEFKNMVLSGDMKGAEQNFKGQSAVKQSENEAWLAYKKAKAEANKPK